MERNADSRGDAAKCSKADSYLGISPGRNRSFLVETAREPPPGRWEPALLELLKELRLDAKRRTAPFEQTIAFQCFVASSCFDELIESSHTTRTMAAMLPGLGLHTMLAVAWTVHSPGRGIRLDGVRTTTCAVASRAISPRMDYGDAFYQCAAAGSLPADVFEVTLEKPLGIQFEEDGPNFGKNGVSVIGVVDGGSAIKDGTVQEGDKLVGVTAIRFQGSKWERDMFDARKWDFDTVVDAIGSNEPKFECYDVVLQFKRGKGEALSEVV